MIITIKTNDEELSVVATKEHDNETGTYPEVISSLLEAMQAYCETFKKGLSEAEIDGLHDYMSAAFSLFMEQNFPGNSDFGLSDAAIIYAQDMIIADSMKKGIPVAEAIKAFNSKAEKHFLEKKNAGKMS